MEAVATSSKAQVSGPRVLLVAPPAKGGLATHVITLLSALARQDYPVAVACEAGRIAEAASERLLPIYPITCTSQGGPWRVALRGLTLAKAIADFRPQVVHAHSFGASTIAAVASTVARAPRLLLTIHNYPPGVEANGAQAGMASSKTGHRWALAFSVGRAHRIITVSEALRRDLLVTYPEVAGKCLTIYNGIDTQVKLLKNAEEMRAAAGLPPDGPLVGMVARLAPQKGIMEFIQATAIAAQAWPTANFVLAGDGPLMSEAQTLREKLGLERRLQLLGHVEWARELIGALDLLVVSSLTEGSSVVAMEAMALGKPVVATAVGGVPEVVADGQTGLLVPPGEPEALASAIIELLADPARAQEMGARGRQRATSHFDVNDMIERTRAVYADLVREQMEAGGG